MFAGNIGPGLLVLCPFPQRHLYIGIRIIVDFFTNPYTFKAANRTFTKSHKDRHCIGIRNRDCLTVATLTTTLCFPVFMGRKIIVINDVATDAGRP